jgi:glycosyltransferase involved in cell wall biosynthesis
MTPFISVIMPAYNSEPYIADAIGSLLSQTAVEVEVIVVSDGSTDGTERIVDAMATNEPRIRLLVEKHCGVAAARNAGLAAARANLITFLDSDDLCAPGRLQRQAQFLIENETIEAVIGDLLLFDIAGPDGRPGPRARTQRVTGMSLTNILFRRSVFERIGHCDETFLWAEDMDFLLRLWERRTAVHFEGEVAVYYRRHSSNMTNNRAAIRLYVLRALHQSLTRRRQDGNTEPLPPSFGRFMKREEAFQNG